MQSDGRVSRQVRSFSGELLRIAGEHHRLRLEVKRIVCGDKRFQEPAAEKPGPASHKQAPVFQVIPSLAGVSQDVFKILRGERHFSYGLGCLRPPRNMKAWKSLLR